SSPGINFFRIEWKRLAGSNEFRRPGALPLTITGGAKAILSTGARDTSSTRGSSLDWIMTGTPDFNDPSAISTKLRLDRLSLMWDCTK
ncbi:unnamed protein product, partial [Allacma fusca]